MFQGLKLRAFKAMGPTEFNSCTAPTFLLHQQPRVRRQQPRDAQRGRVRLPRPERVVHKHVDEGLATVFTCISLGLRLYAAVTWSLQC
jgi:hypothetical protein